MKVYVVYADVDAYPEDGGGITEAEKIFKNKTDAQAYCYDQNLDNCGEYGEYHYYYREMWVE